LATKFLLKNIDNDLKKTQPNPKRSFLASKNFLPCRFETRLVRKNLIYIILNFNFIVEIFKFISEAKISVEPKWMYVCSRPNYIYLFCCYTKSLFRSSNVTVAI